MWNHSYIAQLRSVYAILVFLHKTDLGGVPFQRKLQTADAIETFYPDGKGNLFSLQLGFRILELKSQPGTGLVSHQDLTHLRHGTVPRRIAGLINYLIVTDPGGVHIA